LVGNLLLELLIQDQNYSEIVLLSRQDLSSSGKVKVLKTNFEDLESIGEEINGDECFCCLGTTMKKAGSKKAFYKIDHNYPLKLARIAAKNGIGKYLLVTSLGANPRSSFYYNRVKGEVEDSISKLDYKSIHIFRPSLILGKRNEKRTAETIGKYFSFLIAPLMVGPLKKYRPIKASDIAQAMLIIAHKDEKGVFLYESDLIKTIAKQ